MIASLKSLHSFGYLHRDIKPDNFLVDLQDNSKIYLIDLGLIKKYVDEKGEHFPFREGLKLCGTPRYLYFHLKKIRFAQCSFWL